MSKLSKLDAAIQQLNKAEDAILEARAAFDGDFEFSVLTQKSLDVAEITWYITSLFRAVETSAAIAAGLKHMEATDEEN